MCGNLIIKDREGFILIEVLVTVVILSIGLTLITRSMMMSLQALDVIEQYMRGYLLLERKILELEIGGVIEADLDIEENFSEPYEEFRYRLETQNIDEDGLLNQVRLSVDWPTKRERRQISIVTYLRNKKE
jgi:prepilin-type N-terminal cleavage/methylation domain-containing protein